MRQVRYDRFDGIEQLWIDDVPIPEAAADLVVVQVHASCINPGSLSALHGAQYVPVRDLAGSVTAVGEGAHDFTPGDEVLGWLQDWSAHAEFVAVPAGQLAHRPPELSWDVAGSLFVTPMAGLACVNAVDPHAEEVIVVAGASGGVGLTAGQLARRRGATVIGIAGADSAGRLEDHGIIPVSYAGDVIEDVQTAAGGRQIDAFIDAFGPPYVDIALALNVPKQRINTVVDYQAAQANGVKAQGTMNAGGIPALRKLADLAVTGELDIPIASTYPLDQVQAAYRTLAKSRPLGRIVLHPQE